MPGCIHDLRDLIIEDILVCSASTFNTSLLRCSFSFSKTNVNYFNGLPLGRRIVTVFSF